jgi:hypothetical protein
MLVSRFWSVFLVMGGSVAGGSLPPIAAQGRNQSTTPRAVGRTVRPWNVVR